MGGRRKTDGGRKELKYLEQKREQVWENYNH